MAKTMFTYQAGDETYEFWPTNEDWDSDRRWEVYRQQNRLNESGAVLVQKNLLISKRATRKQVAMRFLDPQFN